MKTPPIRRRTRARELAMQFLYENDLCGGGGSEPADHYQARLAEVAEGDAEVLAFTDRLVRGTLEHRHEIDEVLRRVARNWEVRRMAVVDRNILRMAIFELTWCPDIPAKVTINEAIDMGKKFSTANSGGFANGILDKVRIDLERQPVAGGSQPAAGTDTAGPTTP